jgi:hypothetical protein
MEVQTPDTFTDAELRPRRSVLARIAIVLLIVAGLMFGIMILTAGGVVWWMRSRNLAARDWIETEVARIQQAGEPITTADCYAFQARLATPDITQYWITAIDALDEKQLLADGKLLPVVGSGSEESLRPDAPETQFDAVQAFLQKNDSVLQAVLFAARQPGHCSLPVKFEDGLNARLDHVQALRQIARLLKLQLRVRAYQGDIDGAIESLGALVATSEALNHELIMVEYLVSLAIGGVAEHEAKFLLNERALSDEQLSCMQRLISGLDPKGGLTIALYGERAMGYYSFNHLGTLVDDKQSSLHKFDGQLPLPVDCQTFLQWSRELIEYSREDFPLALDQARGLERRIKVLLGRPIERLWHVTTLLIFPATTTVFEASAKAIARKETTVVAIAAERFRLKHGEYPKNLDDLVPEFLAALPKDPFTGDSLSMARQGNDLMIYSVGPNRMDDGGNQGAANDPLDIVAQLRSDD